MSWTHYDASVGTLKSCFNTLSHILDVAEKHPDAASFPSARLHEDMRPLTFQIHTISEFSAITACKLTDKEPPKFENNLETWADMRERIATLQKLLDEADRDVVNANGDKVLKVDLRTAGMHDMVGSVYAGAVTMPNIMFHVAIAYAILRNHGVPLGKYDYIMGFISPHMPK
jgi:hypothetical protein